MNEQDKPRKFDPKKTTQVEPSPWTEPFQRAQDNTTPATQAQNGEKSRTAPAPAAHMDQDTRDALSTIFNGQ